MLVLGLQNMRDAAAAVVRDGRVAAAAEEERFVRIKHVAALPVRSIRACLKEIGAGWADVDAVAVPWKYWEISRRVRLALGAMLRSRTLCGVKARRSAQRVHEWVELAWLSRYLRDELGPLRRRPVFIDHHLCHAASSFLLSPYERAAILVVDGASESNTTLMALGEESRIRPLRRLPLPHSLGQFYGAITAFLGLCPDHDEYIVMGLAAYGDPRYAEPLRRQILRTTEDGGFILNAGLLDFHLACEGIFVPEFVRTFGVSRRPDEEFTQRHRDIAASAQLVVEETLLHLARALKRDTGADRLCLAGGVAFNCLANSRLRRELEYRDVFVQPAAGDAGAALGAALWLTARRGGLREREVMHSVYLGPGYSEEACRKAIENDGLAFERLPEDRLCDQVAANLAKGQLVFWFQGRMEWGPRALGNRSLLADPRREDMRELINAKVKLRQPFRPFAPSVLEERAGEFFETMGPSPFMLFTVPTKPAAKGLIPAVTHVDGTARIHTVDRGSNPKFRKLLEAFDRLTGVPVLLNTSFNVNEPIVCTPEDAIACFRRTEGDWLVLGNFLVRRPPGMSVS